jgi:hypothetical protein
MSTVAQKRNVKVTVSLEPNTLEALQKLQQELPVGALPDMVRFLMLRGLETVTAERARRIMVAEAKAS